MRGNGWSPCPRDFPPKAAVGAGVQRLEGEDESEAGLTWANTHSRLTEFVSFRSRI